MALLGDPRSTLVHAGANTGWVDPHRMRFLNTFNVQVTTRCTSSNTNSNTSCSFETMINMTIVCQA